VIQAPPPQPESTTKPLSVGGEKLHAKAFPDLKIMIQVKDRMLLQTGHDYIIFSLYVLN
jgi:hypothetical protein